MSTAGEAANQHLVDQLIARGALWSPALIEAFRTTPRHLFLDRVYHFQRQQGGWREVRTNTAGRHELRLLYADRALTTRLSEPTLGLPPVPISSSSQPSLMAEMLEDLRLSPGLRTLEIGAGTGYNAALLSHAVGRVVSLEVDRRVLAEAEEHLSAVPGSSGRVVSRRWPVRMRGGSAVRSHPGDGGGARPGTGLAGAVGRGRPVAGAAGPGAGSGLPGARHLSRGRLRGPAHPSGLFHAPARRGG